MSITSTATPKFLTTTEAPLPATAAGEAPTLLSQIVAYWKLVQGAQRQAIGILGIAVVAGFSEALSIGIFPKVLEGNFKDLPAAGYLPGLSHSPYLALVLFLCVSAIALTCSYLSDEWSWDFRTKVESSIRLSLLEYFENLQWETACQTHSCRIHRSFTTEAYEIAVGAYSLIKAGVAAITLVGLISIVALFSIPWCLLLLTIAAMLMAVFLKIHRQHWAPLNHGAELLSNAIERIGDTWSCLKYSRSTEEFGFVRTLLTREIIETSRVKHQNRVVYPRIAFAIRLVCLASIGLFLAIALQSQTLNGYAWIVPLAILYRMVPHVVHMHAQLHDAHTAFPWILSYQGIQNESNKAAARQGLLKNSLTPVFEKEISIESVSFHYPQQETAVFANANLSIPKGTRVGVTGTSGSGKSTLMDLITGLIHPGLGRLCLDDRNFDQLNLSQWRRQISLVAHEPLLFNGTIEENIIWGQPRDQERLTEVMRQAAMAEWVANLPRQAHTHIGELGKKLSRGQQQRIAIARALYRQPQLLILDEPTNALDATSYKTFCHLLQSIPRSVTVLLLTHDIDLLQFCDACYQIEDQKIELRKPALIR